MNAKSLRRVLCTAIAVSSFLTVQSNAGTIAASVTPGQILNFDLTAAGSSDWAVWGIGSNTSLSPNSRKLGGSGAISNLTEIPSPNGSLRGLGQFANYGQTTFNWTNGTPIASATGGFTGLQHQFENVGGGFRVTVAAGTLPQRLKLFNTVNFGKATITARLSDNSAPVFTQALDISNFNQAYTTDIDFVADSHNQSLTIDIVLSENILNGNVAIQGLALAPVNPSFTEVYATGTAVPGAGVDPRIQTGALWSGFGAPAINNAREIAFLGKWKAPAIKTPKTAAQSGLGIFRDGVLIAKSGEAVPGYLDVFFKGFKDPVMDENGNLAFIGTIKGTNVTSASDSVIVVVPKFGVPTILAREGFIAPSLDGAVFKGFSSVSVKSGSGPSIASLPSVPVGLLFTASLVQGSGSPAVTAANDSGAWIHPLATGFLSEAVREGAAFGATSIKSFTLLKNLSGSPGQGRGHIDGGRANALLTLADKRQVLAQWASGTLSELFGTGDELGGATLGTAKWAKLNLPSFKNAGAGHTMLATLIPKVGGVTSANARGLFQTTDAGTTWNPMVLMGDSATGVSGAIFSNFRPPVQGADSDGFGFIGTVKGVPTDSDTGIWWRPASGALKLVAREKGQPVSSPSGAQWKAFGSLALPGGRNGPLFLANLVKGAGTAPGPGGITAIDDLAFYGVNSTGTLFELIREDQPLVGKTVKSFNVLRPVSGSPGVTRAFNSNGNVVALVKFTDKSSSIVRGDIP